MFCKGKKCEIVCDGKVVGTITHNEDGLTIKCTDECKKMHNDCCKE